MTSITPTRFSTLLCQTLQSSGGSVAEMTNSVRALTTRMLTQPRIVFRDGRFVKESWGAIAGKRLSDLLREYTLPTNDAAHTQDGVDAGADINIILQNVGNPSALELIAKARGSNGFFTKPSQFIQDAQNEVEMWPVEDGEVRLHKSVELAEGPLKMRRYVIHLLNEDNSSIEALASGVVLWAQSDDPVGADAFSSLLGANHQDVKDILSRWYADSNGRAHKHGYLSCPVLIPTNWERVRSGRPGAGASVLTALVKALRQFHPGMKQIVLAPQSPAWPTSIAPGAAEEVRDGAFEAQSKLQTYLSSIGLTESLGRDGQVHHISC